MVKSKSVDEHFSEMPFAPLNINNSDSATSVPAERYSLNQVERNPEQRMSKKERRRLASEHVVKSPLRWPLLFLFVNCVVAISSFALCFSPSS
jgi:hypothetical protein